MSRPVFWWTLLLSVLTVTSTSASEEDIPPASAQEALGFLASLQQGNEGPTSEYRKMANNMYELLQLAALQQQLQRQRLAELEEGEREEGEELPVALPLQAKLAALQDSSEYWKNKRGSYMSLCHFKICNMGRKRSSLWNTYGRI